MYRKNYYANDPRWITAKYNSTCFCGKEIKKGDRCYYYPSGKKVACEDCGHKNEMELIDDDNNCCF